MKNFFVILLCIFVIGLILIIYFINNNFTFWKKRRSIDHIYEAELDLEEIESKGMLEYRRFVESTLQYNY